MFTPTEMEFSQFIQEINNMISNIQQIKNCHRYQKTKHFFGTMFRSYELIKTIFHLSGNYDLVSPVFDLTFLGTNNASSLNNITIAFYPYNVNISMNNSVCLSLSETETEFSTTRSTTISSTFYAQLLLA